MNTALRVIGGLVLIMNILTFHSCIFQSQPIPFLPVCRAGQGVPAVAHRLSGHVAAGMLALTVSSALAHSLQPQAAQ